MDETEKIAAHTESPNIEVQHSDVKDDGVLVSTPKKLFSPKM